MSVRRSLGLFPAERNDDFLIAAGENNAAVFNRLHRKLVGLGAKLEAKRLSFRHHFAVDDGEAGALIERDRADHEGGWQNVGPGVFSVVGLSARDRFPADGPE